MPRIRLDQLLVDRGDAGTLKEAVALVMSGNVLIDENVIDKPGTPISPASSIRVRSRGPYVSRGGLKLAGALEYFSLTPDGWVCADIGASSGGFTDCLLQAGAVRVYAIDVAYGILDWKLRSDPRVVPVERCNIRKLDKGKIDQPIDLAVFDTSFISLTKVIPPVLPLFEDRQPRVIALVKPQFECSRDKVSSGGIVTAEEDRLEAVAGVERFCRGLGLVSRGFTPSPITGTKGNREYLVYLEGRIDN